MGKPETVTTVGTQWRAHERTSERGRKSFLLYNGLVQYRRNSKKKNEMALDSLQSVYIKIN